MHLTNVNMRICAIESVVISGRGSPKQNDNKFATIPTGLTCFEPQVGVPNHYGLAEC